MGKALVLLRRIITQLGYFCDECEGGPLACRLSRFFGDVRKDGDAALRFKGNATGNFIFLISY
ncbi:MAG TPA: hypothetical protein VK779_00195 [Rhizomicrobium sp.]|jgi:hypothetical protein|nr:hypothetical protein [Rhizomicrobium sp.]